MQKNAPLVLMILDGWGYNEQNTYNAIASAQTPQWDDWWAHCPHTLLQASGLEVGLPEGQMGNSEVGHMHIGAGRVIEQDFTRINAAITQGEFANNDSLIQTIAHLKKTDKSLHIMGLLSSGGVHSHEQHLFALLAICHQQQFYAVNLHLFLDGRDCPPQSALSSLELLDKHLEAHPVAEIRTVSGRYYAMDRDNRWERVIQVYDVLTQGVSEKQFFSAKLALMHYYQNNLSDEFIPPTVIGAPKPIEDGDALLYFNFRADRARALTEAFVSLDFSGFLQAKKSKLSAFISMTQYDKNLATTALFPPTPLANTLGEVIAANGLRQLRIAETEKYAHVTFFFNGGRETCFAHEERLLIPSPKIATYDLKPEMSAFELTATLVRAIKDSTYDVIICNYANADMVGHSGNFDAAVQAIECLDKCMSLVWQALAVKKGLLLITADHGNAETMFDEDSAQAHTAHTSGPVPFLCIGGDYHFVKTQASLIDVAPTILSLLDLPIPDEMTGRSLLEKNNAHPN
ncbi:MAG: 2,3-bisphosphoglycerate-independent phosphoglycerate mutase [Legionella sp.]|nr:2,3-bisphosphoglycerate-independent phosphoglycerate mutase [Legionella sp.]